jgi:hypothetical protein
MFPKSMYIGTLDRDILKNKCNVEKTRKHIISIWHPYNVYKPIWFSNHKELNSFAKFYRCKGWFD